MCGSIVRWLVDAVNQFKSIIACLVMGALGACASVAPITPDLADHAVDINSTTWAKASGVIAHEGLLPQPQWQNFHLPGKRATHYLPATQSEGRIAIKAHAQSAASMLRLRVKVLATDIGRVRFSWKVQDLVVSADMGDREKDDAPVRTVFAFDGDRSLFSLKNTLMSELSHSLTGEPMPYAVLMYVWSKTRPIGTVIHSPRTDRIRKIVIESGSQHLNEWRVYERDLKADFETAFHEPAGNLVGIGIMTDTDNTQSTVQSHYGPLTISLKTP